MARYAIAISECSPETVFQGKRLLPTWIDRVGRETPDKVCASMPQSIDLTDGFRDVQYRHLVAAIDTVAWWIESIIGQSTDFVHVSSKQCRWPQRTNGKGIDSHSLIASGGMRSFRVARLDLLLSMTGVRPFPYERTFEEAAHDPIIIVHTSGTTGMPKPIVWTHAMYATIDAQMVPSDLEGHKNVYATMKACERHYSSMPISHSSGLVRFLRAIFMDVILVVGPPERLIGPDPASLKCVEDILQQASVDAAYFLPSTLEALLLVITAPSNPLNHSTNSQLTQLDITPLSKEAGETITKTCPNTILHNSLGSTDGGAFVTYEPDREEWQYILYCPHYNGIDWRYSTNGLYEMVIVRDPDLEMYQGTFTTHPQLQEWSTRDLYSKHPTKSHHWRHEARVDDLIVSANGAKFNPLEMQKRIQQHPEVKFALMTGTHRLRPALTIQLLDSGASEERRRQILEDIWTIVSKMNEEFSSQGRVQKSLIMFTIPGKDFPMAGKGTVQRAAAIQMYQSELDELYDLAGSESGHEL